MQKVEGSSPFIRFARKPCKCGAFVVLGVPNKSAKSQSGTKIGYQTGLKTCTWAGSLPAAGVAENVRVPVERLAVCALDRRGAGREAGAAFELFEREDRQRRMKPEPYSAEIHLETVMTRSNVGQANSIPRARRCFLKPSTFARIRA